MRELLEFDAFSESAARLSIRLYLELGDRESAHREYDRYKELLAKELHAEPGDGIKELFVQT